MERSKHGWQVVPPGNVERAFSQHAAHAELINRVGSLPDIRGGIGTCRIIITMMIVLVKPHTHVLQSFALL